MINNLQPHQQRVVDEKNALDEKIEKLQVFLTGDIYENLLPEEQGDLSLQKYQMKAYSDTLARRISRF